MGLGVFGKLTLGGALGAEGGADAEGTEDDALGVLGPAEDEAAGAAAEDGGSAAGDSGGASVDDEEPGAHAAARNKPRLAPKSVGTRRTGGMRRVVARGRVVGDFRGFRVAGRALRRPRRGTSVL
jgi:hypothetical protein